MQLMIFYIFAAIAVMSAIMVITRRNIVHCALFLVLTILCIAGIYILLHAEFIAAIQVLLYAGSVIVMFLFVIMVVDLDIKQVCFHSAGRLFLVFIFGILFLWELIFIIKRSVFNGYKGEYTLSKIAELGGNPKALGELLYTKYLFPFEVISLLLLVAVIGVVILAKQRKTKK